MLTVMYFTGNRTVLRNMYVLCVCTVYKPCVMFVALRSTLC